MLALQQLSCLLECLADPPAIRIDDGKERLDRFLLGFDVELDITAGAAGGGGRGRGRAAAGAAGAFCVSGLAASRLRNPAASPAHLVTSTAGRGLKAGFGT